MGRPNSFKEDSDIRRKGEGAQLNQNLSPDMLSLISLTVGKVKGLASTLDVDTENHIFSSFHCIYPHKFMLVCTGLGSIGWGPAGGRGLSVPASCSCPLSFSSLPSLGPTWLSKTSVLQRKLVPQGQRGPLNTVSQKRRGR